MPDNVATIERVLASTEDGPAWPAADISLATCKDAECLLLEMAEALEDLGSPERAGECGVMIRRVADMRVAITHLTQNFQNVRRENHRLRLDGERLDWLNDQRIDIVETLPDGSPELVGHEWRVQGQCAAVRTAIDNDIESARRIAANVTAMTHDNNPF